MKRDNNKNKGLRLKQFLNAFSKPDSSDKKTNGITNGIYNGISTISNIARRKGVLSRKRLYKTMSLELERTTTSIMNCI